ncbi:uncharacterized protein LOC131953541 [Physella acuta]|uniref:uncharacterized protein LOC131953541 n=1 Tax=Physella acuta TaxID=109671 RepID=UPI0027DBEA5D|nr:uncharacterized protein LOC131953541 [Physella acuta]
MLLLRVTLNSFHTKATIFLRSRRTFKNWCGCIKPKPNCAPFRDRWKAAAFVVVCTSIGAALPMFLSSLFDEEGNFSGNESNNDEDVEKPQRFKRPRILRSNTGYENPF